MKITRWSMCRTGLRPGQSDCRNRMPGNRIVWCVREVIFVKTGMCLFGASCDFNTSCFWMKNVVSLRYGSAGGGESCPFLVQKAPFPIRTIPMTGFSGWLVGKSTWHVVFFAPACMENYKACTLRRLCRKVKNVNVILAVCRLLLYGLSVSDVAVNDADVPV